MRKKEKKQKDNLLLYEIGKFMLDIAKYLITGVIITALYKDFEEQMWLVYVVSTIFVLITFITGVVFIKLKES